MADGGDLIDTRAVGGADRLPGANDASSGAPLLKATRPDVGGLAVGQWGDTIAVAGDPLADVTLLQAIPVVIKGGVLVKDTRR